MIDLSRRSALRLVSAMAVLSRAGGAWAQGGALRQAAAEAWTYGLPLIEMAAQRGNFGKRGQRANRFNHRRTLTGAADRGVTAPNNDTLYSSAFLDLTQGPVTLTLPPSGARYLSLALMDMFTDNFAVLGTRTTGGGGGSFTLVAPRDAAPAGAIRATTPWVWALARTLVDGPADLEAVHALQDAITVTAPSNGALPPVRATRDSPWPEYFAAVAALLAENPPPATDAALFARTAALNVRAFDPSRFTPAQGAEIAAGVAEAKAAVTSSLRVTKVGGWSYPVEGLGDFGQDYAYRAAVAWTGLAALPRAEAMYIQPVDASGSEVLTSDRLQRLHFAAGALPPAGAFWSLTMYERTPERQYFLTPNPLNRYAIGDRTPGLKRNADGGLDLWIGRRDPGGARTTNWLPAPASGPYRLSLRLYLPKAEALSGAWRAPALTLA